MSGDRWHFPMLAVVLVASVAIVFASLAATVLYVNHTNGQRRDEQVASCERGNAIRTNVNRIVAKVDGELKPLPIVDCKNVIR